MAESSRFEGTLDLPFLQVGPDDYSFVEPLAWSIDVTNTGSAFLVVGNVRGRGVCECSRCLEDVAFDFDGAIEGYFLFSAGEPAQSAIDEDEELGADEFDVLPDDHIIDILPLIEAALRVDAPQMPLCKDDCAGLCPSCGKNLNEGDCGCAPDEALAEFERASNPFSVLADLEF